MDITEAAARAEKEEKIKWILEKGGFLCSAFEMLEPEQKIDKWTLNYYEPESGWITSVVVDKDAVKIGFTEEPLKEKKYKPFKGKIRIPGQKALQIARAEMDKYGVKPTKVLISLQKDEREYWNITFITGGGTLVNVKVDIEIGDILGSSQTSLFGG